MAVGARHHIQCAEASEFMAAKFQAQSTLIHESNPLHIEAGWRHLSYIDDARMAGFSFLSVPVHNCTFLTDSEASV